MKIITMAQFSFCHADKPHARTIRSTTFVHLTYQLFPRAKCRPSSAYQRALRYPCIEVTTHEPSAQEIEKIYILKMSAVFSLPDLEAFVE